MQRIGFLKWTLGLSSSSQPQTLEALSRSFSASVTRVVPVPSDRMQSFRHYARRLNRYEDPTPSSAQIQDILLSDGRMPSHTGAVTGDLKQRGYRHSVYVEIPTWAVKLQLLRAQNYTLTDRGRVLLSCDQEFSPKNVATGPKNAMLLNLCERYVALFCFLDADGDALRETYRSLISMKTFSRFEAGQAVAEGLKRLRSAMTSSASGRLQQIRARIDRALLAVDQQKGDGLGPKESIATPRTEPLVDCGLLTKPNLDTYEYGFTPWGKKFFESLLDTPSVTEFLDTKLTSSVAAVRGRTIDVGMPRLAGSIAAAYQQLRSGLGYVSLRELAVATVAHSMGSDDMPLHEIFAIEKAIREGSAKRLARLALGREVGNAQVRLDLRALESS